MKLKINRLEKLLQCYSNSLNEIKGGFNQKHGNTFSFEYLLSFGTVDQKAKKNV